MLQFDLTESTFLGIEKEFDLHKATLHAFNELSGTCSSFVERSASSQVERLSIVLKAPQKYQIANYAVSVSHKLNSNATNAMLYGQEVTQDMWPEDRNSATVPAQLPSICNLLRKMSACWGHPLLIPTILILHHYSRLKPYVADGLWVRLDHIQLRLGVTKVGSSSIRSTKSLVDLPIDKARVEASRLTELLNTYLTEVLQLLRLAEWELECIDVLNGSLTDIRKGSARRSDGDDEIEEMLKYLSYACRTLLTELDRLKACANCQLDVVSILHLIYLKD